MPTERSLQSRSETIEQEALEIIREALAHAPAPAKLCSAGKDSQASLRFEDSAASEGPFRMPVQYVNRLDQDFHECCGRVAQGSVRVGDRVRIVPSGAECRIESIMQGLDPVERADVGQSVTLIFDDPVDMSRGDVICAAGQPVPASDQFAAKLLWMADRPLVSGRPYKVKIHTKEVNGSVSAIKYRIDIDSGAHLAARQLRLNDIGVINLSLDRQAPFTPFAENPRLGAFILIDRMTNQTAGAGMIEFALRRASNIHWQALSVDKQARAGIKRQIPRCIWLTGLSGSGKSTVANLLEKKLHTDGVHTFLLDGDNVRHGLNRDLGFTEADRVENLRRVAEVSKLMVEAGLVVIVSFISPFRAERASARSLFAPGEFVEVFIDTSLEECERRDPKGLYAKARSGQLANFTGIDSPYEPPQSPEIRISTTRCAPAESVEELYAGIGGVDDNLPAGDRAFAGYP